MTEAIKLSHPPTREFWEVPVLFEDEHLLALDKPARMLISPDRLDPQRPNLLNLLHAGIGRAAPWAKQRGVSYLMNAHRLDPEASGVILLAKNKPALVALANLFGSEKPTLTFLALAQGNPPRPAFQVNAPLAPHPAKPGLFLVDAQNGKHSLTHFELVENFRGWSLLQCRPATARTHQVRVHLRHAGLPLAGDASYGGGPLLLSRLKPGYRLKPGHTERPLMERPALHAVELKLPHPVTGAEVVITAPWPKDLTVAVKYLRRYAAGAAAGS